MIPRPSSSACQGRRRPRVVGGIASLWSIRRSAGRRSRPSSTPAAADRPRRHGATPPPAASSSPISASSPIRCRPGVVERALPAAGDCGRPPPARRTHRHPHIRCASLGHSHLRAAGFTGEASIAGLTPDCRFRREVLGDVAESSLEAREADVLEAADRLAEATPGLAAVLLEMHQFPAASRRHRAAVATTPVHDIWDVVQRLRTGQRPAPRTLSS